MCRVNSLSLLQATSGLPAQSCRTTLTSSHVPVQIPRSSLTPCAVLKQIVYHVNILRDSSDLKYTIKLYIWLGNKFLKVIDSVPIIIAIFLRSCVHTLPSKSNVAKLYHIPCACTDPYTCELKCTSCRHKIIEITY